MKNTIQIGEDRRSFMSQNESHDEQFVKLSKLFTGYILKASGAFGFAKLNTTTPGAHTEKKSNLVGFKKAQLFIVPTEYSQKNIAET